MESEVTAALIHASGTVVAALIGVAGVFGILKHRSKVQRLSEQVEAYYPFEGELVREIYRLRNNGDELPDPALPAHRGRLRKRLARDGQRPSMTAREAAELRDRLI